MPRTYRTTPSGTNTRRAATYGGEKLVSVIGTGFNEIKKSLLENSTVTQLNGEILGDFIRFRVKTMGGWGWSADRVLEEGGRKEKKPKRRGASSFLCLSGILAAPKKT